MSQAPLPDPDLAAVTLRGGDLAWRPVSPRLRTVRWIGVAAASGCGVIVTAVLAIVVDSWFWLATGGVLLAGLWLAWIVDRQVGAMSWLELREELVIRKGRLFRSLVSVPYGRMQYVDVQSGPLLRAFGLASIEIHTASPQSGGQLSGLEVAEAEALRTRLAARGEGQRAGL